jgi:hypothetical protein
MERPDHAKLVNSLNVTDEYANIVLPGYGPRRDGLLETVGAGYGASLKALIGLALGAAVMLSTWHGTAPVDHASTNHVAADERD